MIKIIALAAILATLTACSTTGNGKFVPGQINAASLNEKGELVFTQINIGTPPAPGNASADHPSLSDYDVWTERFKK